jgi:hypothetical protein
VHPVSGESVDAPEDLMGWLAQHPALYAEQIQPAEIAGLSGAMLDAHATTLQDTFAYPTGNMRVNAGDRVRYYVLPLDGPDLTIVVLTRSDDAFDEFKPALESVLHSLVIHLP